MDVREDLGPRLRQLVGEMSPLGVREASAEDRIMEDLGYDSLSVIELALVLETEFELQPINEEEAMDIVTVADLEAIVRKAVDAHG